MYVAITGKGKARVIQFCEQERIPGTDKKRTRVIKTLGNYEKLLENNPNIIEELKEEAREWSKQKQEEKETQLFRFGHSLIHKMWEKLELRSFFETKLGKEKASLFLQNLYPLMVYRLGSSYQNFRVNRKTPFLNLQDVPYENFYQSLEILASFQKELHDILATFFIRETRRQEGLVYTHRTFYEYNRYWKELHAFLPNTQENKDSIPFSLLLSFDSFGIPISFTLEKGKEERRKCENSICILEEEEQLPSEDFLASLRFSTLDSKIQKQILEESDWQILERHADTKDILYKEKSFLLEGKKFYVNWSKLRAFRDYTEGNGKEGFYCLMSNRLSLDSREMLSMFQHTRNIEEKFRISNVSLTEKHILGHFTLCFLCLSIVSYFQYLLGSEGRALVPMIYASKAISNPMVLIEGKKYPYEVYPIHITNSYKKLARLLGLGDVSKKMTLKAFESLSQLSLSQISK